MGTSIGIAHFPEHGRDAQTLVRNADIAMYAAKRSKSGYAIYDPHYDTSQQEHLSLLGELRRAVERNELRLYYQPKVSLHSANISAVEALIRWEHPIRGLVPPGMFIPFAEHTGYIKLLTRWVLREAVRQCGEWLREGLRLQVSVNISARDLMNRDLPAEVAALLAEYGVPPALLCLEITESGFMEDPANAQKVLDRLAELGVRLSIDDYGTGYSSLSYIMRLPVQELKIDRSFISRMAVRRRDLHDRAIDHRPRPQPGAQGGRRGRRGSVGMEHAAFAGLRRCAGLLHEPAARAAGAGELDARQRRNDSQARTSRRKRRVGARGALSAKRRRPSSSQARTGEKAAPVQRRRSQRLQRRHVRCAWDIPCVRTAKNPG